MLYIRKPVELLYQLGYSFQKTLWKSAKKQIEEEESADCPCEDVDDLARVSWYDSDNSMVSDASFEGYGNDSSDVERNVIVNSEEDATESEFTDDSGDNQKWSRNSFG